VAAMDGDAAAAARSHAARRWAGRHVAQLGRPSSGWGRRRSIRWPAAPRRCGDRGTLHDGAGAHAHRRAGQPHSIDTRANPSAAAAADSTAWQPCRLHRRRRYAAARRCRYAAAETRLFRQRHHGTRRRRRCRGAGRVCDATAAGRAASAAASGGGGSTAAGGAAHGRAVRWMWTGVCVCPLVPEAIAQSTWTEISLLAVSRMLCAPHPAEAVETHFCWTRVTNTA